MTKDIEFRVGIERAAAWLRRARRPFFITGAGISADSGLPTYRGVGGIYEDEDTTEDGVPIEVALSGSMIESRPEVSWRHIARIENGCRSTAFNRGHEVIAEMEASEAFDAVWTLTQNVDGFHTEAGSKNVIDIHGDYHKLRCDGCGYRVEVAAYRDLEAIPPPCPECGHHLRPDVVFFGEMLPEEKYYKIVRVLNDGVDMIFSVGTTSVFPYIAMPVVHAARAGIPTVEINPGETEVSPIVSLRIRSGAARALDAIWDRYREMG